MAKNKLIRSVLAILLTLTTIINVLPMTVFADEIDITDNTIIVADENLKESDVVEDDRSPVLSEEDTEFVSNDDELPDTAPENTVLEDVFLEDVSEDILAAPQNPDDDYYGDYGIMPLDAYWDGPDWLLKATVSSAPAYLLSNGTLSDSYNTIVVWPGIAYTVNGGATQTSKTALWVTTSGTGSNKTITGAFYCTEFGSPAGDGGMDFLGLMEDVQKWDSLSYNAEWAYRCLIAGSYYWNYGSWTNQADIMKLYAINWAMWKEDIPAGTIKGAEYPDELKKTNMDTGTDAYFYAGAAEVDKFFEFVKQIVDKASDDTWIANQIAYNGAKPLPDVTEKTAIKTTRRDGDYWSTTLVSGKKVYVIDEYTLDQTGVTASVVPQRVSSSIVPSRKQLIQATVVGSTLYVYIEEGDIPSGTFKLDADINLLGSKKSSYATMWIYINKNEGYKPQEVCRFGTHAYQASATLHATFEDDDIPEDTGKIEVNKKDPNGRNLSGAIFTVYDSSGKAVATIGPTNSSGYAISGDIPYGTYTIRETTFPKGYTVSGTTSWTRTISSTTSTITINATNAPTLKIIKTTDTNGGTIKGWKFSVYTNAACTTYATLADGSQAKDLITDASGLIMADIDLGNYTSRTFYVKETGYFDGASTQYWNDLGEVKSVTLVKGEAQKSVTFTNHRYGIVRIIKTTDSNGGTVRGWKFTVYTDSRCREQDIAEDYYGNKLKDIVTGSDGTILIDRLDPGKDGEGKTYYIKETGYPDTATPELWNDLPTGYKTVTVKAGNTYSVTFENSRYGLVTIRKTATNGGRVDGWKFTVYTDSRCREQDIAVDYYGNKLKDVVSGSDGTIFVDRLNPGTDGEGKTYYIKETGYPDWMTDTQKAYWGALPTDYKTVNVTAGGTRTVTFDNPWYGIVRIIKTVDSNGGTKSGWKFTIYNDSRCRAQDIVTLPDGRKAQDLVADSNGTITEKIAPGTYYVKETGYFDGATKKYWNELPTGYETVTITAGNTGSVTFENHRYGLIEIKKTATNNGTKEGWSFTIYLDPACTRVAKFVNGKDAKNLITNGDGIFTTDLGDDTVDKLVPGTYYVREDDKFPAGMSAEDQKYWILDLTVHEIVIRPGATLKLDIDNKTIGADNEWDGTITIVKDTTNGGTKAGWIFSIYTNSNCTTYAQYYDAATKTWKDAKDLTTTSTGIILTGLMKPGDYWVKETGYTSAIDGHYWYMEQNNPQKVTVEAGKTKTVTFLNQYGGDIEIIKTTTNNKGTVEGWVFNVYESDGTTIATFLDGTKAQNIKSGKNGHIVIPGLLNPGTYYVKEVGYPASEPLGNYYWNDLPTTPVRVTVEAGKTKTASFENTWYGRIKIIKTLENPEAATLSGWIFNIYTDDKTTPAQMIDDTTGRWTDTTGLITDSNGNITTGRMNPGVYWVEEVGYNGDVEFGYWMVVDDKNPQSVTAVAGQTVSVTFDNALRPGKITVHKTDAAGKALAKVVFQLEYSEDGGKTWTPVSKRAATDKFVRIGTTTSNVTSYTKDGIVYTGVLITNSQGEVTFEGLYPLHMYRLTEIATVDGKQLLTQPVMEGKLLLDENLEKTYSVVNHDKMDIPPTGSLGMVISMLTAFGLMLVGTILIVVNKRKNHNNSQNQ